MSFGMELLDANKIGIVGGIRAVQDRNLNFSSSSLLDDFWCFSLDHKTFSEIIKLRLPCPRASFGLIKHRDELLLIAGLEISGEAGGGVCATTAGLQNSTTGRANNPMNKKNLLAATGDVLACRLLQSSSESLKFSKCKRPDCDRAVEHYWYGHSKLGQQRIFPSVGRLPDRLLVAGGKTQDHCYFKRTSLASYCSTYEVLNCETQRWVESPIMFATFGSSLIGLH